MTKTIRFSFICIFITVGCNKKSDPTPASSSLYFPPTGSITWETVTPASLGWNESAIPDLQTYLINSNTRAFIVLKDGKIAIEQYNGVQLTSGAFTSMSLWYWASAGK